MQQGECAPPSPRQLPLIPNSNGVAKRDLPLIPSPKQQASPTQRRALPSFPTENSVERTPPSPPSPLIKPTPPVPPKRSISSTAIKGPSRSITPTPAQRSAQTSSPFISPQKKRLEVNQIELFETAKSISSAQILTNPTNSEKSNPLSSSATGVPPISPRRQLRKSFNPSSSQSAASISQTPGLSPRGVNPIPIKEFAEREKEKTSPGRESSAMPRGLPPSPRQPRTLTPSQERKVSPQTSPRRPQSTRILASPSSFSYSSSSLEETSAFSPSGSFPEPRQISPRMVGPPKIDPQEEPQKVCVGKSVWLGNRRITAQNFASIAEDIAMTANKKSQNSDERKVSGAAPVNSIEAKEARRKLIVKEIITTEQDYSVDLATIVTRWVIPIRQSGCLTMELLGCLFSNVEILSQYMHGLLRSLTDAEERGELENSIGNIFLANAKNILGSYTVYCLNYDEATNLLVKLLKKNKEFQKKHNKLMEDPIMKGLTLGGFLVKPVQRLCKYPLLLRELISNTKESHPDFHNLQAAYDEVQKCVKAVNENSKSGTNTRNLKRIEQQLCGKLKIQLCVSGRRFIHEGRAKKVSNTRTGTHIQERHFLLFNDLLLYAEPVVGQKKFRVKGSIDLADYRMQELLQEDGIEIFPRSQGSGDMDQKSYAMLFRNTKEKKEWVKFFEEAFDEIDEEKKKNEAQEGEVAAFTISGNKDAGSDQVKLLQVRNKIEGFQKAFGVNFNQKCVFEGMLMFHDPRHHAAKYTPRCVLVFEGLVAIAKRKSDARNVKNSLIIEKKIPINDLKVQVGNPTSMPRGAVVAETEEEDGGGGVGASDGLAGSSSSVLTSPRFGKRARSRSKITAPEKSLSSTALLTNTTSVVMVQGCTLVMNLGSGEVFMFKGLTHVANGLSEAILSLQMKKRTVFSGGGVAFGDLLGGKEE